MILIFPIQLAELVAYFVVRAVDLLLHTFLQSLVRDLFKDLHIECDRITEAIALNRGALLTPSFSMYRPKTLR